MPLIVERQGYPRSPLSWLSTVSFLFADAIRSKGLGRSLVGKALPPLVSLHPASCYEKYPFLGQKLQI